MRRFALIGLVLLGCGFEPEDETAGYRTGRAHHDPINGEPGQAGAAGEPTSGEIGGASTGGEGGALSSPEPPPTSPLAQGIAITEIAVFQGVKVPVAKSGARVSTRTVPVIAGRDGLIRVYVTPEAGYTAKELTAELHLVAGGQGLPIARDTKTISGASSEQTLASTFNFDVPGSSLPAGVEFFVQILDSAAPAVPTAESNTAQYPMVGGTDTLGATMGTDSLKIVLVPVRYGADGSNRVPDTSAAMVDQLRRRTLALYPVPSVDITVHAPIDHGSAIVSDGTGWEAVLAEITQLRMTENPAADVYYYGVFAPAATLSGYCSGSCVLGLSNFAATASEASMRASAGILYNNPSVLSTLPHELGHAHGRRHAPCGSPAGADPSFPYSNATIGVWGYNIVSKQLFDPQASTQPHDFMSYCGPEWTSDYTFKALFDRVKTLGTANVRSLTAVLPKRPLRILFDRSTGPVWHAKPAVWTDAALGGEERTVTFVGEGGTVLATAIGHRYTYDHLEGGYLVVPDAPIGTTRVIVEGVGEIAAP